MKTEILIKNLQSPEGPSFDKNGRLHFVDWDARNVYQFSEADGLKTLCHTGGIPTGSKFHQNGDLYVADGDLGILRISPNGEMVTAADNWQGLRFRGPNDLIFSQNGDCYFTDPKGSSPDNPTGSVYLLRNNGEVERFATGFQFPNGIVLSADEKTLYLAETFTRIIWAFELDENGMELNRREFAQLEGGIGPDGMAFDEHGNLYAAHFGKGVIAKIDLDGKVIEELPVPGDNPTNVSFHNKALYVTEVSKGQVIRLDINVDGQRLFGDA